MGGELCRVVSCLAMLAEGIVNRRNLLLSGAVVLWTVLANANLAGCGGGKHSEAKPPARAPIREVVGSDTSPTEQIEVITLPEGFTIPVRITDEINSKHAHTGEMYSGSVDPSVLVNDVVVIPRGTEAHIRMNQLKKGGHVHGNAKVSLELVSLIINGRRLEVESNELTKKKSAASTKAEAVTKKAPSGGDTVAGAPAGAALPVIAAFSAAKVQVKPGSRVEFKLEAPFTFRKPPVVAGTYQPQ
jgi:hypothetical protein